MNSAIPHSQTGYTHTAIGLHWLIGIAIVGTFALGLYMHELPLSPQKLKLYSWHKWAGVTIFLFALLRLTWPVSHRPPALPAGMPGWQRSAAEATHVRKNQEYWQTFTPKLNLLPWSNSSLTCYDQE